MDSLFSKTVKAGDRTYFIDVKEAKNKSKYLTIAESKLAKEGEKKFSRSSVMIFDNQIEKFRDALDEALKLVGTKQ
jgi:3-hydroxymyristoyl/3-hydroxydecanoyl-(acyl carrier protein) dehydratase